MVAQSEKAPNKKTGRGHRHHLRLVSKPTATTMGRVAFSRRRRLASRAPERMLQAACSGCKLVSSWVPPLIRLRMCTQ